VCTVGVLVGSWQSRLLACAGYSPVRYVTISLESESKSKEKIYLTSPIIIDVVLRMFTGVERGVELFRLIILKL
jgi:hypothetical protein